jgi:hypothetical protein
MKKIKELIIKVNKLDNSEKDFLIIAFAFLLVALFLFFSGILDSNNDQSNSRIYFGFTNIDPELIEINEVQKLSCMHAHSNNACSKLEDTLIVNQNICCKKLEMCCS